MIDSAETTQAKINTIKTEAELEGFRYGLQFQGGLCDAALHMLAVRKVEIQQQKRGR